MKTLPKVNPLSFSAAAVACTQESFVNNLSWDSAEVHGQLLGIIPQNILLPSLTPAIKTRISFQLCNFFLAPPAVALCHSEEDPRAF